MWTVYQYLGEVLQHPSDRMERFTPWVMGVIGGSIVAVMAYAWWTAPAM